MEIIDACWEIRNLGVRTSEIRVSTEGDVADLKKALPSLEQEYSYLCAKVSSTCPQLVFQVDELGFSFVEDQLSLRYSPKDDSVSPSVEKISKSIESRISLRDITNDDARFAKLMEIIAKEKMFTTDRIAIDPLFGPEKAAVRYVGWCEDLRGQGAEFYIGELDQRPVSFNVVKQNGGFDYSFPLGGTFPSCSDAAVYTPIFDRAYIGMLKRRGMRTITTAVSSNNKVMLQLHLLAGYQISKIEHVYIKHARKAPQSSGIQCDG